MITTYVSTTTAYKQRTRTRTLRYLSVARGALVDDVLPLDTARTHMGVRSNCVEYNDRHTCTPRHTRAHTRTHIRTHARSLSRRVVVNIVSHTRRRGVCFRLLCVDVQGDSCVIAQYIIHNDIHQYTATQCDTRSRNAYVDTALTFIIMARTRLPSAADLSNIRVSTRCVAGPGGGGKGTVERAQDALAHLACSIDSCCDNAALRASSYAEGRGGRLQCEYAM
jgi:hypothetical protein